MALSVDALPRAINADLMALFVGEKLGEGQSRQVHLYVPDTSLVVKLEHCTYKFDNVAEWEVWRVSKGTHLAKWLAPCITISERGCVLIQRRTRPIPPSRLPKKVPRLLADTKAANWGLIERGGRMVPVCHDYAHHYVAELGIGNDELVPAKWHSPEYTGWQP